MRKANWPLLAVLAFLLVLAFLGSRLRLSYATPLTGCVHDYGTGGGLGLWRWGQRLGFSMRALDVPLWEAPRTLERPTGNSLITMGNGDWTPMGEAVTDEDWFALRNWLMRGNCLIVVTTAPLKLPEPFRQEVIEPRLSELVSGKTAVTFWSEAVASDVETVRVPVRAGGSLTVAAEGPRWQVHALARDPATLLAADDHGGICFRIPLGEGSVYLLLDGFAWTNAGLDHGGNAEVLAALLAREVRGGVIGVDEYRHGHGRAASFLSYLLKLPGAPHALGIAVLWGLLFLVGRNVRLRPAEAYEQSERRTAQEFVDAVAQLQERARAAVLVVEAVARRLRHLSRGPAELTPKTQELLQQADRYVAAEERPVKPAAARALVVELVRIRKQLHGSRTLS